MHLVNSNAPYNAASKVLYKDKLTVMKEENFFVFFLCKIKECCRKALTMIG